MKAISTIFAVFGLVPLIAAAAVPAEGMAEVAFEGGYYGGYGPYGYGKKGGYGKGIGYGTKGGYGKKAVYGKKDVNFGKKDIGYGKKGGYGKGYGKKGGFGYGKKEVRFCPSICSCCHELGAPVHHWGPPPIPHHPQAEVAGIKKDGQKDDKKLDHNAKKQANNENANVNLEEKHTAANEETAKNFENDVKKVQADNNKNDNYDDTNTNKKANKDYQNLDFPKFGKGKKY
ncbi:hypothetical protein BDK51DRAFT_38274 [Blyttiomyces helicus]|uniref:Uncharacterized protein n=1 Tax=Blyttiomyces helicus TaxID=388810 RepID=A0A4P9W0B2_9FUNG|nr:hypothetical protein BDK51DRAFT_38274 [Blyttiomyces helicus]|eukprot:RKO85571.1 hypothetical protein BDK51DRAFT_38274 [Blyttiomyces helicus]